MAASETIYTFSVSVPDFIERARTKVLKMPAYRDGAIAAPASGTFTLKDSSGTVYVSASAVTVSGGVAQYSLAAATIPSTVALGNGWIEEWALVMPDGTTRTPRRMAAISLKELFPTVSLGDARALHSTIDQVLADTDSTGQAKLDFAWGAVYRRIVSAGHKPYLILNAEALHEPLLYLWLHLIFNDAKTSMGDGTYKEHAADYKLAYEDAWKVLQLTYDTEEDGRPTGDDVTVAALPPVFLSAVKGYGWR